MLVELHIKDFALVAEAAIALGPGFTVLTGETGAGKSILVDAIDILLGERAGAELVRTGAAKAQLTAVFDLADSPQAAAAAAEMGIELEDGLLYVAREITPEGRNPCRVNGRPCPVSALRAVGDLLVDLHGQHEHQALLRTEHHQAYLDRFGGEKQQQLLAEVAAAHSRWREVGSRLRRLQEDEGSRLRELDLLRFQLDELAAADPQPGEDEALAAETGRLANAERLARAAEEAYGALCEGVAEGLSALDLAGAAERSLADAARYDPDLEPLAAELAQVQEAIQEAGRTLSRYREGLVFDPARLEQAQGRLHLLEDLKRKYGGDLAAVIAYREEAAGRLAEHEGRDELVAALTAELAVAEGELAAACSRLSAARRELAAMLAERLSAELADLAMPAARFEVGLDVQEDPAGLPVEGRRLAVTAAGVDRVEFMFSANAGEPPKPLAKVASGGEVSRVMLAIKSALAAADPVPTLIFDEVDVGIGGRTAEAVGQKLGALGRHAQVVCVTHLPQIAYRAAHHLAVEKAEAAGRTTVAVQALAGEGRIEELARMQAGGHVTPAVLEHIRQVLAEVAC